MIKWGKKTDRAALDGVEPEHVAGLRDPAIDNAGFTVVLSGGDLAYLSEKTLAVDRYPPCRPLRRGPGRDRGRAAVIARVFVRIRRRARFFSPDPLKKVPDRAKNILHCKKLFAIIPRHYA